MMKVKLKYSCIFCGAGTNFKDNDKPYCIDCYIKLRNSAHTHETPSSLPKPIRITPMPTLWPEKEPAPYTFPQIIC